MGSCYKGHCLRGALTCLSQYLYCYYKGNKIDLQGKMLSQFTQSVGRYTCPHGLSFGWQDGSYCRSDLNPRSKSGRFSVTRWGLQGLVKSPSVSSEGPWKLGSQLVWAHSHTTQRCSHFPQLRGGDPEPQRALTLYEGASQHSQPRVLCVKVRDVQPVGNDQWWLRYLNYPTI